MDTHDLHRAYPGLIRVDTWERVYPGDGPQNLAKPPEMVHLSPMTEITARLSTALADRYGIERHREVLMCLASSHMSKPDGCKLVFTANRVGVK